MTERRTVIAQDPREAFEYLDRWLNQEGQMPEAIAYNADEQPLLVWLDEVGGDEVQLRAALLHSEDGATSAPARLMPETLTWPIEIVLPDHAVQPEPEPCDALILLVGSSVREPKFRCGLPEGHHGPHIPNLKESHS